MKQKNLKKITYLEYKDLIKLSKTYGQSFFILDSEKFRKNYIKFSKAFKSHYPKICIGYSYKTNYTPHLCQIVNQEGGYAEIASEMEYEAAKKIGVPFKKIIYNGPNKSKKSFIEAARKGSIINLDNANEISFLKTAARINLKKKIKIVLRMNFDIGKKISRFGFDPEGKEFNIILSQIRDLPNVSLVGLHCHFPFRDLKSFNFDGYVAQVLLLSRNV